MGERCIWLSDARSLNDASEVEFGLGRARALLMRGDVVEKRLAERVVACLAGAAARPDYNVATDPFVAAFCMDLSRAPHWISYGRSGQGFAVGFSPLAFHAAGLCHWRRVLYEADEQDRLISAVLSLFAGASGPVEAVAVACTQALRVTASQVKHPSFRNEREWRLVCFRMEGKHVHAEPGLVPPTPKARSVSGRSCAYGEAPFDPKLVQSVVAGYSAVQSRGALESQLVQLGISPDVVSQSDIPVRP